MLFKFHSNDFLFLRLYRSNHQSRIRNMVNGFKIITLCGSTRFKTQFIEMQKKLSLKGYIVISVGSIPKSV